MGHADLADYAWLLTADGQRWLAVAAELPAGSVAAVERLRAELSPARTSLLLETVELRARGEEKFGPAARRMLLTRKGLEQSSDALLADYKGRRLATVADGRPVADLCCGLGGDLLGIARQATAAIGVEHDPLIAALAAANVQSWDAAIATRTEMAVLDVRKFSPQELGAWHLDPDRRPGGRRTTQVAFYEPDGAFVESWLQRYPHGAAKLAPAARLPHRWETVAEQEWISRGGVCRQLVAWFGATADGAGEHRATIVGGTLAHTPTCLHAEVLRTIVGRPGLAESVDRVGAFLCEPDAAVLAAELTGPLSQEHALRSIGGIQGYLTADGPVEDAALDVFAVQEVMPFHVRKLRSWLRERKIGRLEIKKRGVAEDPHALHQELAPLGEQSAVLLLMPIGGSVQAVMAQRWRPEPRGGGPAGPLPN